MGYFKRLRVDQVVGVHEVDVLPSRRVHAYVARVGYAAVGFAYDCKASVAIRVFLENGAAAVRAAVVYAQRLPIVVCLVRDAIEAAA